MRKWTEVTPQLSGVFFAGWQNSSFIDKDDASQQNKIVHLVMIVGFFSLPTQLLLVRRINSVKGLHPQPFTTAKFARSEKKNMGRLATPTAYQPKCRVWLTWEQRRTKENLCCFFVKKKLLLDFRVLSSCYNWAAYCINIVNGLPTN